MSNVKHIKVTGTLPFNCADHDGMSRTLATLNSPGFGLLLTWTGSAGSVPSAHGGRTAMYSFEITGREAVSNAWVESVLQRVVDCGGTVGFVDVKDTENGHATQAIRRPAGPTPKVEGRFAATFVVQAPPGVKADTAEYWVAQYLKDVIAAGVRVTSSPPVGVMEIARDRVTVRAA